MSLLCVSLFLVGLFSLSLCGNNTLVSVVVDQESLVPHHVEKYRVNSSTLVVRRGVPVVFRVEMTGPNQSPYSIGVVITPPKFHLDVLVQHDVDNFFLVQITTPVTAPVSSYSLAFTIPLSNFSRHYPADLVVLFNPYFPEDQVFLPDEDDLKEFIENEYGMIWQGSSEYHSSQKWYYAQFNRNSLLAALHLLSLFKGDASDPVQVARYFTFAATYQSKNTRGLLVGNWGDDFSDGTAPTAWTGTAKIMDKYVTSGFRSVKYGQCWVFGGVLSTLLRTVGIPARQLITFGSAHESPVHGKYRQVIEYHYTSNGRLAYAVGSIWNFHSWNEMWLHNRNDGPAGWQAVDSTPQEYSEGVFQMGPAPLASIKDFDASIRYDVPFVRSEVAAVLENWLDNCVGKNCTPVKIISNDTSTVADLIITPTRGSDTPLEITWDYKHKPTTKRQSLSGRLPLREGLFIEVRVGDAIFGQPVEATINYYSSPSTPALPSQIDVRVEVHLTHYTGNVLKLVKEFEKTETLSKSLEMAVKVDRNEYQEQATSNHHLLFIVYTRVGGDLMVTQKRFSFQPATIGFHLSDAPVTPGNPTHLHLNSLPSLPSSPSSRYFPLTLSFTNPLSVPLKDVVIHLDAAGLTFTWEGEKGAKDELVIGTIAPLSLWKKTVNVNVIPGANGKQRNLSVLVNLVSDKLTSRGFVDVVVKAAEEKEKISIN